MKKVTRTTLGLPAALLIAAMAAAAPAPQARSGSTQSWRDRNAGFGRPEVLTGTITLAKPEEGLLVVKRQGPDLPPTTEIIETETLSPDGVSTSQDQLSVTSGPGEADYRFRLTTSTVIRVNGQRVGVVDLADLEGKQATVYFVAQRSGNYVQGIEVSQ